MSKNTRKTKFDTIFFFTKFEKLPHFHTIIICTVNIHFKPLPQMKNTGKLYSIKKTSEIKDVAFVHKRVMQVLLLCK